MLLMAKLVNTKLCKNPEKPLKPLANGYSSESAQQELSNEYQHDRVLMVLKHLCILVLLAKVATALEGLRGNLSNKALGISGLTNFFIVRI